MLASLFWPEVAKLRQTFLSSCFEQAFSGLKRLRCSSCRAGWARDLERLVAYVDQTLQLCFLIFPDKTLPLQPAARSAFQNCAHQRTLRPLQIKLCTCGLGNAAKPAFVGFLVILVRPITLFRTLFSIDFFLVSV